MSDERDDTVTITLELPADLAAQLEHLRQEFGDELLVDLLHKANAAGEGKLALRGGLLHKDREQSSR